MMYGYHFWIGKDVFVETSRQRKTKAFATAILEKLEIPSTEGNVKDLLYRLRPATCEIRNGWYDIKGENFGGYGSKVDDGRTIVIRID